jgi:hypothetical protein
MTTATPSLLPPIDAVEVVDLADVCPDGVEAFMNAATDAPSARMSEGDAQRIAALWRGLPAGHQARCHNPPFGLRFYHREQLVCQASICWECNNIFGSSGGERLCFEFDASDAVSCELLAACERALRKAS